MFSLAGLVISNKEGSAKLEVTRHLSNLLRFRIEGSPDKLEDFYKLFNDFYRVVYDNFFRDEEIVMVVPNKSEITRIISLST
mgnify:CR=1 FL=1